MAKSPKPATRTKPSKKTGAAAGDVGQSVSVDIEEQSERWSEYKLVDGSTLRIRPVVFEVLRDKKKKDSEGNPVYHIKASIVTNIRPK